MLKYPHRQVRWAEKTAAAMCCVAAVLYSTPAGAASSRCVRLFNSKTQKAFFAELDGVASFGKLFAAVGTERIIDAEGILPDEAAGFAA